MKSYMNKFICLIAAIIFSLTSFSTPAMAAEKGNLLTAVNETGIKGSITIQLEETKYKVPLNDVKFAVVKVADVIEGEFVLLDIFSTSKVDLNSIQNANTLEETAGILADFYKENGDKKGRYAITDEKGLAKIDSLDIGVYLIYPLDIAKYEEISPFLISIPTFNNESGHMMYDILVHPKHAPYVGTLVPEYDSSGDHHGSVQTGDSMDIKNVSMICIGSLIVMCACLRRKKEVNE